MRGSFTGGPFGVFFCVQKRSKFSPIYVSWEAAVATADFKDTLPPSPPDRGALQFHDLLGLQ